MTDRAADSQRPIGSELVKEDASFADIVIQFVDSLGERMKKMEDAVRAADFEMLRVAAHQLKGSGGGYGYPILTDRAANLERRAKAQTIDDCANAVAELKQLCTRIVPEASE